MKWAGYVARMGGKINAYRVFVGKRKGKSPLQRPRRRWEDNIKMHLIVIGWTGSDWIHLARDRDQWRALVNTVINSRVQNSFEVSRVAERLATSQELSSMELDILTFSNRNRGKLQWPIFDWQAEIPTSHSLNKCTMFPNSKQFGLMLRQN
jgi:hypothetical protein